MANTVDFWPRSNTKMTTMAWTGNLQQVSTKGIIVCTVQVVSISLNGNLVSREMGTDNMFTAEY